MLLSESNNAHEFQAIYGFDSSNEGFSEASGAHDNVSVTHARIQADDGSCVLAGCTMHAAGSWDFWLLRTEGVHGLAWASATNNSITLYRGMLDPSWNDIRVRIWKPKQNP